MTNHILATVICYQFERAVGRWQSQKDVQRSMDVNFVLDIYSEKEEGYRNAMLRIYGDMNYVAVLVKEDWHVVPLVHNSRGETFPFGEYTKGESSWKLLGYHDSGWREAVATWIRENDERIKGIDTLRATEFGWYQSPELTVEDREVIRDLISQRDNRNKEKIA